MLSIIYVCVWCVCVHMNIETLSAFPFSGILLSSFFSMVLECPQITSFVLLFVTLKNFVIIPDLLVIKVL